MDYSRHQEIVIPERLFEEWQGILEIISELVNASLVFVAGNEKFLPGVFASYPGKEKFRKTFQKNDKCLRFYEKVLKNDLSLNNQSSQNHLTAENCFKSAVDLPLNVSGGVIFGSLCVFSEEENFFDEKTNKVLEKFKHFFETGLENLYLFEELEKNKKEKSSLAQNLKTNQEKFQRTINSISEGVLVCDSEGTIDFANKTAGMLLGEKIENLIGKNLGSLFNYEIFLKSEGLMQKNYNKEDEEFEIKTPGKSGTEKIFLLKYNPKEKISGEKIVLSFRDATENQQQGKRMDFLGFHDNLTNLYNRAFLEEEFTRLDVKRQMPTSLLIADLNGLKLINNSFGFNKGDLALKKTAEILKKSCRSEDIISRWGGDEFVILLPRTGKTQVEKICSRIKKNCKATEEEEFPISLSLGVAEKTSPGEGIHSLFQKAENRMLENKLLENRSVKNHVLKALLKTLAEKSSETEGHALRMKKMAYMIGEKMGLSQTDLDRLSLVAMLHDLGKTIISEEILEKPGPLTKKEWNKIKQHPETGYRIASSTEEFTNVAPLILYHHEWWDGSGYPSGLAGEEIPLLARIISLVDAYDVMTTGRPYKEKVSPQEAARELRRCAGIQFDPELVEDYCGVLCQAEFD